MAFTRQKARAVANPEYPARTQPGTNIHEVQNTRRTVFIREHNNLFIQRTPRYSQEDKSYEFYLFVLGFNESSTEDDMKKPIVPWLLAH